MLQYQEIRMEVYLIIGFIDMHGRIEWLIVLILTLAYVSGVILMVRSTKKRYRSRTFVYPKTGHRYYVEKIVKAKNPTTGEWHKSVLYRGVDDGQYYVRDKEDFLNKFIPMSNWNGNNN